MEVLNERAFRQLIKMYKSIKFEDLAKLGEGTINLHDFLNGITGFGSPDTCTLCRATIEKACGMVIPCDCDKCLYIYTTGKECNEGPNMETYLALSKTNCDLYKALAYIYHRYTYMKCVYDDYLRKVINETEIELNNIVCDGDDSYSDSAENQMEYILQLERRLKCFNKKMDILYGKGL